MIETRLSTGSIHLNNMIKKLARGGRVYGIAVLAITLTGSISTAEMRAPNPGGVSKGATAAVRLSGWERAELGGVNPSVFALALAAASRAVEQGDVANPRTLTVIDFSKPSTTERMWVYDLRTRTMLYKELVSHGRGSGLASATQFSNVPESNRSSLGLFVTAESYVGKNGYSLRLDGLEDGVNDRARERAIVIHGAPYVDATAAKAQGYLGRSLGCPAVRPAITRELIDTVRDGSLVFAYYPDEGWLRSSKYLRKSSLAVA